MLAILAPTVSDFKPLVEEDLSIHPDTLHCRLCLDSLMSINDPNESQREGISEKLADSPPVTNGILT